MLTRCVILATAALLTGCASLTPAIHTHPLASDADARACTETLKDSDDRALDYAACLIARGYAATVSPMGVGNRVKTLARDLDPDPHLFLEVEAAQGQRDAALVGTDLRACRDAALAQAREDREQASASTTVARALLVATAAVSPLAGPFLVMTDRPVEPYRAIYVRCAEERGYAARAWRGEE